MFLKSVTLPFTHDYITKMAVSGIVRGYNGTHDVLYNTDMVDAMAREQGVQVDLPRIKFRFGKKGENTFFPFSAEQPEKFFEAIVAQSKKDNVNLTLEEAKILVGYMVSESGTWLQQGAFGVPYLTLNTFMVNQGFIFGKDEDNRTYEITKKNGEIIVTISFEIDSMTSVINNQVASYDGKTLLKQKNVFKIFRTDKGYDYACVSDPEAVLVHKDFWDNELMDAVNKRLNNLSENDLEKICLFDVISFIPFMKDTALAAKFFKKMMVKPLTRINVTPGDIIDKKRNNLFAPFDSLADKIACIQDCIETCFVDSPAQKNRIMFQFRKAELTALIDNNNYNKEQRMEADKILTQISVLDTETQNNNILPLTNVLETTMDVIRRPMNIDTQLNCKTSAEALMRSSWGKRVGSAMLILLGVTILAASIVAAAASFGATTVLSSVGVVIATNIMMQSLTIASAAAGVSLIGGGLLYANNKPLQKVYNSTLPFWKIAPPAEETEVVNTKAVLDDWKHETATAQDGRTSPPLM